ncbi:MAG: penicillin-binding transpeptidase domain-containing protein [Parvularculaceae bacterium]
MLDAGFITREQADFAYKAPVRIGASRFAGAPYFVDFALAEARKVSAGADGDLLIKTTFDAKMQDALETGVVAGAAISRLDERIEIAAVILDAEGGVKAMVGGRDYRLSQFNRASNARRQPGSAFKPFVYLAALELGASPDDIVADKPISIGKWSPSNYNDKYYGDVTLREGLSRSLNGATIRLQEQVGRGAVRIVAKRMGYPGALNQGPALALGVDAVTPLDLAAAYAPLVNGGYRVRPHAVSQISFSDGEEVYRRRTIFYDAAATETNLAALNEMLASVVKWGTGGQARLSRFEAHGKTGTTQDNRDAWFAGHAGGLVCVVWVGRDDYKPMGDVTGGGAPAIIWREIMERALASRAPRAESPPILAPLGSAATALAPIGE